MFTIILFLLPCAVLGFILRRATRIQGELSRQTEILEELRDFARQQVEYLSER